MKIRVDGVCRGNGRSDAVAGCGAVIINKWGRKKGYKRGVGRGEGNDYTNPTNQRAELTAMIFALEIALEKRDKLRNSPRLNVEIQSDSQWAVDCMTVWIGGWRENGWKNLRGRPVANQDLIKEVHELWDRIIEEDGGGRVLFSWIPRESIELADRLANEACDEQD